MPLFLRTANEAVSAKRGIWGEPDPLLAYEYRAAEKLFGIAKSIIVDKKEPRDPRGWRERYCVDMRARMLFAPEDYFDIDPVYRFWLWPADVREAIGTLNLTPSSRLVGAA